MGYQQIIVQGNLTEDVKVRQVGQAEVAQSSVAVSEKYRKQDGSLGENTEFFDIEIWNKPAVSQYLTKGTPVLVVGKIKTESWQDQQGQTRSVKKIRVDVIQLCGGRPQQAAQPSAPAPQYAPRPAYAPQYQQPAPAPVQYAPQTPPPPAPAPAPQAPAYNTDYANGDLPF